MKIRVLGQEFEFRTGRIIQSLPKPYDEDAWVAYLRGKGYAVTHSTALRVAVVIRCADVVAKTMASLGCQLMKSKKGGTERATKHPLYNILRMLPNYEVTAYEFWHMYVFSLMLTRGAYAKVVRDGNGFITALWNIPTNNVCQYRNLVTSERYIDVVFFGGKGERLYPGEYMYTPGLRFKCEEEPHDFIKIASDVLGLTMSLNNYAKDFFENGANMGGFVEYPAGIKEEAFKAFRDSWQQTYSGVTNQHKWALLEGGFKLTKFDSDNDKAQSLESRKFEILEVCRIMGVTPHKVFDLDRATFSNIEQMNIEYTQETIDPMAERLEQTIYKDLLSLIDRVSHYAKFNTNKLLKGDTATRTAYYNTMRQNGVFSANDILELEDRNTISDEEGGNVLLVNGNMIPLNVAKDNLPKSLQGKSKEVV